MTCKPAVCVHVHVTLSVSRRHFVASQTTVILERCQGQTVAIYKYSSAQNNICAKSLNGVVLPGAAQIHDGCRNIFPRLGHIILDNIELFACMWLEMCLYMECKKTHATHVLKDRRSTCMERYCAPGGRVTGGCRCTHAHISPQPHFQHPPHPPTPRTKGCGGYRCSKDADAAINLQALAPAPLEIALVMHALRLLVRGCWFLLLHPLWR